MPGEIDIYRNATRIGRAQGIDFKEGTNARLSAAKDIGNSQIDVTINASRAEVALAESGFISEAYMASNATANFTLVTQQIMGSNIGLLAGDVVTNVHYNHTTQGTSVTLARVGIYDTSATPTLVASCASDTTIVDSAASMKTVPLTTPYTVTETGAYTVCLLAVFTGTAPTITRAAGTVANQLSGVGSGTYRCFVKTSQADLPATISWANSANHFWFAVS